MSEIDATRENRINENSAYSETSDDKPEVKEYGLFDIDCKIETESDREGRESAEIAFNDTVESVSEKYNEFISESDRERITASSSGSGLEVMSESEYIRRFPESDINVLGHYDPINEKIVIKSGETGVIEHVSTHEAMHLCSHNETYVDDEGNTVIISGIRETVLSEEGFADKNQGINEGITEMYTIRELESQDKLEALYSVTSYTEARKYALQMEELVGDSVVSNAYFGGNCEDLERSFNNLSSETNAWEDFSRDVEIVEYGSDYSEVCTARTRLTLLLANMTENKEHPNG